MAKLPAYLRKNITLLDVHSHIGFGPLNYLTHGFPYGVAMREAIDQWNGIGVSHAVAFPGVTSFYYDLPALIKGKIKLERRIGKAPFHFENEQLLRQLYEIFPEHKSRIIPFAMTDTLRETRKQVKCLESLLERYPFYGLKVHPRATRAHISTLQKEGKPLLEFARAHDLPILFHASSTDLDTFSHILQIFDLAKAWPKLRFCSAHFAGFNLKYFEEANRFDNIWVDSGAFCIGCDLVADKAKVYESGKKKIPGNYRNPPKVFADIARRFPDTFMWGTDNPAHSWINNTYLSNGKVLRLKLWSSMEREKELLRDVKGSLRKKVAYENALRFLEG